MENSQIIRMALSEGFRSAEIIDTDKIEFNAAFRPYCEANICGQYGANYSCPPDCGTPSQMEEKVLKYKKALVLSTEWEIEDFSQADKLKEARLSHNAAMLRLIKNLKAEGHNGIMIGASGCMLCTPCKMAEGEKCAFPDVAYSCMSAYCINVKKLAEDCNINYDYKNRVLPFFGAYIFD